MLIFMSKNSDESQRNKVLALLDEQGIQGHATRFGGRPVIVAVECRPGCLFNDPALQDAAAEEEGVEEVIGIAEPYPLCSKRLRPEGSVIRAKRFSVGNGTFGLIAGPCSVETEKRTIETALLVKKAGATALRGGAFKPRTSPYTFQGLKEEGLKILAKAGKESGLAVVTEAMSPEELPLVAEHADIIQIGTRNGQNYRLLEACGRVRIPIFLKRGFSCTLDEFLMSAEYILAGGNERVILCERGIRTFETHVRYTMPIASVPALKQVTHLPIVVDPSHSAGRAELVPAIAYAATAAGADGLLVEVHPDPEAALCDGRQSLTPDEFAEMVEVCRKIRKALD